MNKFNKTLIAAAVGLISAQTSAAGFQLNSQSATGIGRAMAGDAVIADNASVLSRNPAAMALFDETALSLGVVYADIDVSVSDIEGSFAGQDVVFGSEHDAAEAKLIPNFYYINPINDKMAFGVAAFTNYGTGTDLGDLSNRAPTISGNAVALPPPVDLLGNTEVVTINFNTSMSYRVNDEFSFGFGIDAIYASGTLTRTNEQLGSLVDVDADGWALGGIVGVVYEVNPDNRFGLSYRISPKLTAKGDVNYLYSEYNEIDIPLADIAQFAGFHQLTEKFAVHYTAQWTNWSAFDKIVVKDGENGVDKADLKEYHWKDSWFLSLGATYNLTQDWTLRAGLATDQGVVDQHSSLSIPDSDRTWYTAGVSYDLNQQSTVDFGVALVRGEDVTVLEDSNLLAQVAGYNSEISAQTRSNAVYYSVQYNYSF
ncbi:OmpP1/FadL family transporter [Shewanella polaris]|uniref:Aromatic hydrocarbon degradation protein n=1 Tax=Shewanella polaris TaxID=2588449 RepID=A0A4Y5YDJ9_9GAMM|nr:outer membrane protein transport protein [Shewanella polaris]QDE30639.1 aromatic hydrocarbon degradation protein [Shewanella polaris]